MAYFINPITYERHFSWLKASEITNGVSTSIRRFSCTHYISIHLDKYQEVYFLDHILSFIDELTLSLESAVLLWVSISNKLRNYSFTFLLVLGVLVSKPVWRLRRATSLWEFVIPTDRWCWASFSACLSSECVLWWGIFSSSVQFLLAAIFLLSEYLVLFWCQSFITMCFTMFSPDSH